MLLIGLIMISEPLGLYDCDIRSVGAHTLVVSNRDYH
jgi:hypothetical protein